MIIFLFIFTCDVKQTRDRALTRHTLGTGIRMEALLWTSVLGLLSTPVGATRADSPEVSQSPNAISLMKVNSTAEIQCRTTLGNTTGLYLKRRFSEETEVLYISTPTGKITINRLYKHRLSVAGECCDYMLQLSQLGVNDTDGYYCLWSTRDVASQKVLRYESRDTIIIIREKDPKDCNRIHSLQHILFILSVTTSAVVVGIFLGVLVWWCKSTKKSYRPTQPNQGHHHLCPQHSNRLTYSNN
ncbi:uncharacterized protein LOC133122293 [Conger conger]|uniref:uncharacterized protein LOC133122293 n=1 Tax=Conger conger TaxID=82655 RepID=UPI002A5AF504|nr:uncharacterized protein LOC133122293 [Conger conger]